MRLCSNCLFVVRTGVVHTVGGVTALIAAIILGPRKGRFYDDDGNPLEEPVSFPPHSVALQVLGTFILWFGKCMSMSVTLFRLDSIFTLVCTICSL